MEMTDAALLAKHKDIVEEITCLLEDSEGSFFKDTVAQELFLLVAKKLKPPVRELTNCHDCGAKPGEIHKDGCDVERCSVCGEQRLGCECKGHDKAFARWTGIWPGFAEATALGLDLTGLAEKRLEKYFFIKPKWELKPQLTDWETCKHFDGMNCKISGCICMSDEQKSKTHTGKRPNWRCYDFEPKESDSSV